MGELEVNNIILKRWQLWDVKTAGRQGKNESEDMGYLQERRKIQKVEKESHLKGKKCK